MGVHIIYLNIFFNLIYLNVHMSDGWKSMASKSPSFISTNPTCKLAGSSHNQVTVHWFL